VGEKTFSVSADHYGPKALREAYERLDRGDRLPRNVPRRVVSPKSRTCVRCGGSIPEEKRIDARFCSEACKQAKYRGKPRRSRTVGIAVTPGLIPKDLQTRSARPRGEGLEVA